MGAAGVGDLSIGGEAGIRLEDRAMWEVFARRKYEEPLYHVGTVAADDPELAHVYARTIFNEFAWVEMVLYPREAGLRVIRS